MGAIYNRLLKKCKRVYLKLRRGITLNLLFFKYARLLNDGRLPCRWRDRYIIAGEATATTAFDGTYVFHIAWASRIISVLRPEKHIDISSSLYFVTTLSAFVPVDFYDYRPVELNLSGLTSFFGDVTGLSFADNSIKSLSCLHVIEHIGLGRYGDPLDPQGDIKAAQELIRVLSPDGCLLIAVPVGRQRLQFNAHRIYNVEQVIKMFSPLELNSFALIDDHNQFTLDADFEIANIQKYGCGCFCFRKKVG